MNSIIEKQTCQELKFISFSSINNNFIELITQLTLHFGQKQELKNYNLFKIVKMISFNFGFSKYA